jgi:hypothetical protein
MYVVTLWQPKLAYAVMTSVLDLNRNRQQRSKVEGIDVANIGRHKSRLARKLGVLVILGACLTCSAAFSAEWADSIFNTGSHDFGTVASGSLAEFEFPFENRYRDDLHIVSVRSSCGCTIPRIKEDKRTYKSWEKGAIVAKLNTSAFRGSRGATVTVTFDRPLYASVQLHVKTHIYSGVLLTPGSIQLGTVDQGVPASKTLRITTPNRGLSIVGVETSSPHISANIGPLDRVSGRWGYPLAVQLSAEAPSGYIRDHVMLITDGYRKTRIPVTVDGRVTPSISISPEALFMGLVNPGDMVRKQMVVRGKVPFAITNATSSDPRFVIDTSTASRPKSTHVLPVEFTAGDESGNVTHTLYLEMDGGASAGKIEAYAVVNELNTTERTSSTGKVANGAVKHQ